MKKKIFLTIGLPKSGKTTWAKEQGYPIVNRDAIRLALHGQRFIPESEPMVSVLEENMAKALFLAGHDALIIDATHNTSARRKKWIQLADAFGADIEPVFIRTGKEECIKRAMSECDYVIIPVINRMADEADWDVPD